MDFKIFKIPSFVQAQIKTKCKTCFNIINLSCQFFYPKNALTISGAWLADIKTSVALNPKNLYNIIYYII